MLEIDRLEQLRTNWGKNPQVLHKIGNKSWNEQDLESFLRRVCNTISDEWLRVLLNGRYVHHKDLLRGKPLSLRDNTHIVCALKLSDYLQKGATIVVRQAQSYLPDAFAVYEQLKERFGCHVSCNFYAAQGNGIGFREHFDTHHIFVLQLFGGKTWSVSPTPEVRSSKLVCTTNQISIKDNNREQFEIHTGDLLYLPRGCWHSAVPGLNGSVHLSFGIHIPTKGETHLAKARLKAKALHYMSDEYGFDAVIQTKLHEIQSG
jgi:hypothetical protein